MQAIKHLATPLGTASQAPLQLPPARITQHQRSTQPAMNFPKKGLSRKRITGQMPGGFQPEPFVSKPRQPCLPTITKLDTQPPRFHLRNPSPQASIARSRKQMAATLKLRILTVAAAAAVAASSLGPAPAPTSGASMAAPAVAAASLTALVFGYLF
ncbi:hypothetical protein HU200_024038 [Digitaria exilis]|uniref:Uncharacterized protein n=1 Tax=Digitaria exilis TaxID=1010633 RepID=A0A835C1I2_9POAL|nr:hypothetical protein HU200_024038 [Digitaria exilis]